MPLQIFTNLSRTIKVGLCVLFVWDQGKLILDCLNTLHKNFEGLNSTGLYCCNIWLIHLDLWRRYIFLSLFRNFQAKKICCLTLCIRLLLFFVFIILLQC